MRLLVLVRSPYSVLYEICGVIVKGCARRGRGRNGLSSIGTPHIHAKPTRPKRTEHFVVPNGWEY